MAYLPASVIGVDNNAPLMDPDAGPKTWFYTQLYLGQSGLNKYVPNVGDLVYKVTGAILTLYIVTALDGVTLVPTLTDASLEDPSNTSDGLDSDLLIGGPSFSHPDSFTAYINTQVTPHELSLDDRLVIYSSGASYCKVFLGIDISTTGTVISRVYDANNQYLTDNISLEVVASTVLTNTAIKTPVPAYTNYDISDGETVTAVFYANDGRVLKAKAMRVINTGFIKRLNPGDRRVIDIRLVSDFISSNNTLTFDAPVGVTTSSLNFRGVVTYSDGEEVEMPIDGTKFQLLNLDTVLLTTTAVSYDLTLRYKITSGEYNYIADQSSQEYVYKTYTMNVVQASEQYSLKLYCYPVWISAQVGYELKWYLYDQDRGARYDASALVTIDSVTGAFRPLAYGIEEKLLASVNLSYLDSSKPSYIHSQIVFITLNKPGTDRLDNWLIQYTQNQTPPYGINTYATIKTTATAGTWKVKVSSGSTSQSTWLTKLYANAKPLLNVDEVDPIPPTFFAIVIGANRYVYNLSDWDSELTIADSGLSNNKTICIQFIKRTVDGDLELSAGGMPVYAIDLFGNYI